MQAQQGSQLGKKEKELYLVRSFDGGTFKSGVTQHFMGRAVQLGQLFDCEKAYVVSAEDWLIDGIEYQIKKACRAFRVPREHLPELLSGYTEVFWIEAWNRALQIVTCFEENAAFGVTKKKTFRADELTHFRCSPVKLSTAATAEPDRIIHRKQAPNTDIVVMDAEQLLLRIARRLLKLNVEAKGLEIVRMNTLQKHIAYRSLDADQRRIIDYMCRSSKLEEIEQDGHIWRTSFDFFRKLFPNPKTHEEIRDILHGLRTINFPVPNLRTEIEERFSWLNDVSYGQRGSIEIEIGDRIDEYHGQSASAQVWGCPEYTRYYLTVPMGLLLQHQNLFHFILERLKNTRLKLTARLMEITIEELRHLWGLSPETKPYDLERYWLKEACERTSVATRVRISRYEPLRSPTRGRPVYAYRLHVTEETKTDFLKRFERSLELVKQQVTRSNSLPRHFPGVDAPVS